MRSVDTCRVASGAVINISYAAPQSKAALIGNPQSQFRGLGTGLLYHLSAVAHQLGVGAVWGEATQNSVNFYRKIFRLSDDLKDFLYLSSADYGVFRERMEKKYGEHTDKDRG